MEESLRFVSYAGLVVSIAGIFMAGASGGYQSTNIKVIIIGLISAVGARVLL